MTRPLVPRRAVFGREDQLDAEALEEIEVEQFLGGARAVEQRGRRPRCGQRFRQRRERREADTAGDHPGFGRRGAPA